MTLTCCRMVTLLFSAEFRTFVVSSSPSILLCRSALHTPIFQRDPSYPRSRLYQPPSVYGLLKPSRCKEGNCCHGQLHHCNGLDTPEVSRRSAARQMGTTLLLDPLTRRFVSGMLSLVLHSDTL